MPFSSKVVLLTNLLFAIYQESMSVSILIQFIFTFLSMHVQLAKRVGFASWNVNGVRSLLKHDPNLNILKSLVKENGVDVLCLQETKLQDLHVRSVEDEIRSKIDLKECYWNCSKERKGYSGTATLVFSDNITLGGPQYLISDIDDQEGRVITSQSDLFTLVNVYTPNSGEGLKRLDYRIKTWDLAMRQHILNIRLQRPGVPVVLIGDMNVAHTSIDYYNPQAKWTQKQAGTTPEEQQSFSQHILSIDNLKDTYRVVYPTKQEYSYFSARKGDSGRVNREGYRIDYILTDALISSQCPPYIVEKVMRSAA